MSRSVRLSGFWLLTLAIGACVGISLWGVLATAQEVLAQAAVDRLAPSAPPGWGEFAQQVLACAGLIVLLVEAIRIPPSPAQRAPGVQLGWGAKWFLFMLGVAGGQACAAAGWVVAPIGTGSLSQALAGGAASGVAIAFNELLWKKIVGAVQQRLGVEKRPTRRKPKPDVAP